MIADFYRMIVHVLVGVRVTVALLSATAFDIIPLIRIDLRPPSTNNMPVHTESLFDVAGARSRTIKHRHVIDVHPLVLLDATDVNIKQRTFHIVIRNAC